MSDKSKQQISDLMDGELEMNASKFLLKRMASDDSLSQTWDNYHIIKSCLQKTDEEPLVIDVASRVSRHLNHEIRLKTKDIPTTDKQGLFHKTIKPVLGLGIAASVAFVSVLMIQNRDINGVDSPVNNIVINDKVRSAQIQAPDAGISANLAAASSGEILIPPPSLSRFPSVSAGSNNVYSHNFTQPVNASYIFYINEDQNSKASATPITIKDISE